VSAGIAIIATAVANRRCVFMRAKGLILDLESV
jgi:hypothetical protein